MTPLAININGFRLEGNESIMAFPLNGGILLALLMGLPLAAALFHAAPSIYPTLIDDPAVVELGVPYWQARIVAVVGVSSSSVPSSALRHCSRNPVPCSPHPCIQNRHNHNTMN